MNSWKLARWQIFQENTFSFLNESFPTITWRHQLAFDKFTFILPVVLEDILVVLSKNDLSSILIELYQLVLETCINKRITAVHWILFDFDVVYRICVERLWLTFYWYLIFKAKRVVKALLYILLCWHQAAGRRT